MSDAKHTPGPWRDDGLKIYAHYSGTTVIARIAESEHYSRPVKMGCVTRNRSHWRRSEIDQANARLIAAAPDLLAALKSVVAIADRKTVEFDAARAAIARAEGRAP